MASGCGPTEASMNYYYPVCLTGHGTTKVMFFPEIETHLHSHFGVSDGAIHLPGDALDDLAERARTQELRQCYLFAANVWKIRYFRVSWAVYSLER